MRSNHLLFLAPILLASCLSTWRASLPAIEGEVLVEGLDGPVEITRDTWGTPHIHATTDADAVYALGWCHAQDRLWQMELNRRIGAGRLSEVFGKRTVETDRYLRTVGFRARAEEVEADLPPQLRGDRLHVAGATFPGLPLVVIGHNEHVAWGLTNVDPDVQDLVLERFDPDDPLRAEFEGGYEAVTVREEVIEVKGGKDVVLQVRETRHGPVMTEFYGELGEEVALRWTALQPGDRSVEAFTGVNRAASVREAAAAMRHYQGPAQNVVFADRDGHIGWVAAGWVPLRPGGDDGNSPVPGWDGQHEWLGYVPFEDLPQSFDPARGHGRDADGAGEVCNWLWEAVHNSLVEDTVAAHQRPILPESRGNLNAA